MASKGMSFSFDASKLAGGLLNFNEKAQLAIRNYADDSARLLENYAKEHKKWKNRTSHAWQRLTGDVLVAANGYKLRLAHGVDYGKWLELAHEKRYAIIMPTIETVGPSKIMPGFQNLIGRIK